MRESARLVRNRERLTECHGTFARQLHTVLVALEREGDRPRIQDAWRSPAAQLDAYRRGATKLRWGFHNAMTGDGQPDALAADVVDDGAPKRPSPRYLLALAIAADRAHLDTGILWGLPECFRTPIRAAIAAGDAHAPIEKIGWDPCHVEVRGLSIRAARRGVRPGADYV